MSEVTNMEASVNEKCLEFARDINQHDKIFTFTLKFSNGFTFQFSTTKKRNTLPKTEFKRKMPSPSTVKRNNIRMKEFIEKKKTSSNETTSSDIPGESPDVPCVETTKNSVPGESPDEPLVETSKKCGPGESPDVPLVCKDDLNAQTKCEQCGYKSKSSHGLNMHVSKHHKITQIDGKTDHDKEEASIGTETEDTCPFFKEVFECLEKHYVSGRCPKNQAAQTQALSQLYGQQISCPVSGFPPSLIPMTPGGTVFFFFLMWAESVPENKPMLILCSDWFCTGHANS